MRSPYFVFVLVCVTVAACASGYDDFLLGVQASRRDLPDLAISSYTSALNAGDLAAAYVPTAYYGRAVAYQNKQQCAEALADLNAALKLKPDYFEAVLLRARVNQCLNDNEAAAADMDRAVALEPANAAIRFSRGTIRWNIGRFAPAAEDYEQAAALRPKNMYNLLWYAISAGRAGTLDKAALGKKVADLDTGRWPLPLLDFMQGKATAGDVYSAAARGDGEVPSQQKCEADFYIGEWRLIAKDAGAKALLQQAQQECPHSFIEFDAAKVELERLK